MVDDDDGRRRTPDHGHPISSPCEPNGSGELISRAIHVIDLMTRGLLVDRNVTVNIGLL